MKPKCDLCKNRHPQHDDGFEYFDCWNYLIKKKSRKEPTVEIWDKGRKEWIIDKSSLFLHRTIFVPFFFRN